VKRTYQDWFEVWEAEPGLYVIAEPRHFEDVKSYLILGNRRALLVDTGMGIGDIAEVVRDVTNLPVLVINSHAHWDHIGGNASFDEIWIHAAEADDLEEGRSNAYLNRWLTPDHFLHGVPTWFEPDTYSITASRATTQLQGGEAVDLGGRSIEVLHAPGHSPGGLVFVDRAAGFLLSTDVAYAAPPYCYGPGTDPVEYRDTLARLESVVRDLRAVYPSHNEAPIEPGMIARMRAAFDEVLSGRTADATLDGRALHHFDGFSVVVRSEPAA
jgi:glyoxylase-like metal-dependent hydrolase (beta-lactamase superfamily II)